MPSSYLPHIQYTFQLSGADIQKIRNSGRLRGKAIEIDGQTWDVYDEGKVAENFLVIPHDDNQLEDSQVTCALINVCSDVSRAEIRWWGESNPTVFSSAENLGGPTAYGITRMHSIIAARDNSYRWLDCLRKLPFFQDCQRERGPFSFFAENIKCHSSINYAIFAAADNSEPYYGCASGDVCIFYVDAMRGYKIFVGEKLFKELRSGDLASEANRKQLANELAIEQAQLHVPEHSLLKQCHIKPEEIRVSDCHAAKQVQMSVKNTGRSM